MKKKPLFLLVLFVFIGSTLLAQTKVITGTVTEKETSAPIPGVNVVVKGTTVGTITDADGNYSITVPSDAQTLVFMFVGMKTVEVPIGSETSIDVNMEPDVLGLDEVVVTGLGTNRTKKALGYAVQDVKGDELTVGQETNFANALQGRVAGVQITSSSGAVGSGTRVIIRGMSTLTGSNQPLYVVDGVPIINSTTSLGAYGGIDFGNSAMDINPNDIESVSVLKGANAAALYGSRALNGVILITTKEGSKGKPKVNFSMKAGVQVKPEPIPLLTSQQEYDLLKELNAGNDAFFNIFSDYNFNDRENPANSRIDTVNWADINWQDEIMQNSTFQEYSLQLTGGGDKTKYLVSALYRNNEGTIKTAKSDQYVFRINLTNQVARSLEITSNFNLSRKVMNPVADNTQGWNGALINAAFTYPNFIPIYDPDVPDEFFVNPIRPQFDNPDAWIRGKQQESNRLSLNGLLQIKWEILKSLTFLSRNSLSYGSSNSSVWLSKYDTYVGRNAQGMYTIRFSEGMGIGTQNTLTWMQDFGGHSLSVMAGMEVGKGKGRGSSVTGMNFTNDLIREITAATDISGYSNHSQDFNAAYFGRINYAYRGKYLAQLNFRADGSAKFGENNRWAQFPSGSVAWKISEEPFFKKNVKAVNFLKLRFSYGLSGNKPPYNFMYMALYGLEAHGWEDAAYPVTLTDDLYPGYAIMRMENNDLRWETTTEYNVGLDMNMFKNRIVMNIDLYSRTANDLLYIYEPPVT